MCCNLPSLVAIGIVLVEMFLLCHVIKQEYVIKGSYDFMSKNLSREITAIPSLVATDTEVFEI